MGCSAVGKKEKNHVLEVCTELLLKNVKGGNHVRDVGIDGFMILKWNLRHMVYVDCIHLAQDSIQLLVLLT